MSTQGEAFGFLGPNGAGKTSTMRMIGCVSPVTGGDVAASSGWIRDARSARSGPARRRAAADNLDKELSVARTC